jgi:hypothetical protein
MNELITWSFWFNSRPEPVGHLGLQILAGISLGLFLIALIIHIQAYPERWSIYRPSFKRLIPFCITNIVIAIYIFFVHRELVPVLRAYAWYIVWVVEALLWLITIFSNTRKRLKKKEDLAKEAEIKKYLP